MNNGRGRDEVNVVAAAVHIAGGPQRVAKLLQISRSQVYRWMSARTMANATYVNVAKLASLSGIQTQFLGGDGLGLSAPELLMGGSPVTSTDQNSDRKQGRDAIDLRVGRKPERRSESANGSHPRSRE
jgi:hypothetical protein